MKNTYQPAEKLVDDLNAMKKIEKYLLTQRIFSLKFH